MRKFSVHSGWIMVICMLVLAGCYNMRGNNGGGIPLNAEKLNEGPVRFSRKAAPSDLVIQPGFRAEAVSEGLNFPTALAFDDQNRIYIIESGISDGLTTILPRLLRLNPDGSTSLIYEGDAPAGWTSLTWHQGHFYISESSSQSGGRILKISPQGEMMVVVDDLPSNGDHMTNGVVIGPDGYLYFGQGTATNSGVVGSDNLRLGWLLEHPDFHDIPCRDITLSGENFETHDLLASEDKDETYTGAFVPYGTRTHSGQIIKGEIPCSGAVMKISPDGGEPELVAWGFRNPYGLAFAPDGKLFVTDKGFDDRGSRPVWAGGDYLWKVDGSVDWYGWPDYAGGLPLNELEVPKKDDPELVLADAPNKAPYPEARLDAHGAASGLAFSTNPEFGFEGQAFIAQFGDVTPFEGKVMAPVGFRVIRVDLERKIYAEFLANTGEKNGPASWLGTAGLERPVSVTFSPDGKDLYVVDFGVVTTVNGIPQPQKGTGVIWKISREKEWEEEISLQD